MFEDSDPVTIQERLKQYRRVKCDVDLQIALADIARSRFERESLAVNHFVRVSEQVQNSFRVEREAIEKMTENNDWFQKYSADMRVCVNNHTKRTLYMLTTFEEERLKRARVVNPTV